MPSKDYLRHIIEEQRSEIGRHHTDFTTISALCTLYRTGQMTAEEVVKRIQTVVG